ncbi:gamma-glutamyltransferase family protein [Pseudoruegeria sp. HB172150]|uniref:gamma-glutamyltransferase family protein n=1 Tax=Pseudoruegeria sp. HB172150 TaxID=2721164 RepID=UPI0015521463|nr:gamma-glutamyltransferase family protein [Pseudoruegeria sp. HB172150]
MRFTTRPELSGTFGMVASTHWIGSAVGMKILEAGGTAADAAAATGFALNVVEPHLNGPLGDMTLLVRGTDSEAPVVICGQGVAPAAATIAHYRAEGLELIPGSGLLAATVPGAFGAWMALLRDHGRLSLREVLEPAIHYAEAGHPMLGSAAAAISGLADFFRAEWPTSAETWLPGGAAPKAGELFRNPALADFWKRLLREAEAVEGREAQIEAAQRAFYEGFVAEAIDAYLRDACVMDAAGERRKGVLTGQDIAGWRAEVETPVSTGYHGWTIWKAGPWSQGPMLLQCLNTLADDDVGALDPVGPDFVHLVTETLKLGFDDREAYYGDPAKADVPLDRLLSVQYGVERRALIGGQAAAHHRPGAVPGQEGLAAAYLDRLARDSDAGAAVGAGEPTMAHLSDRRGDTVHIDVIDRWGNVVSTTPSGGWLQSNPVIPGLGVPLGTRGQMFWLDEGLPNSLAPGRRPRTTLTPSMALGPDGSWMAFGTPGGDQQEQWQLSFFLRHLHHGMNLQEAIDAPLFHTGHLQSSFYPRGVQTGQLIAESRFPGETLAELRARGHVVTAAEPWAVGRLTAALRRPNGQLYAGATARLMQAYAVGR